MIDTRTASVEALQLALGESIKKKIKSQGTVRSFCEENGISRTTLYSFFAGEPVLSDTFLRILRGLDHHDVIQTLLEDPTQSPVLAWRKEQAAKSSESIKLEPVQRNRIRDAIKSSTAKSEF